MTPQGFTERYSRSQLFLIVAVLGSIVVLGCALESRFHDDELGKYLMSLACPLAMTIGAYFYGYRSLAFGAFIAFAVRLTGTESETSAAFLTIRDIVIASTANFIVTRLNWFSRQNTDFGFGAEGFHSVLKAIPDVLLIIDSKRKVCQVFTGDERLLVRPKEDILGKRLDELMPNEQAVRGANTIDRVLKTGIHGYFEYEITIGNAPMCFAATIVPFEYRGDKAVLWASRETTKLKLVQREQKETEDILRSLLRLQERERKLISCELHDGILQQIIVGHMLSQVLQRDVGDKIPEAGENLATLQKTLSEAIREGRGLIDELRPIMVDEDNVIDAIDHIVKEEGIRSKASITFNFEGKFDEIPPLLEGNIFRIVQEALTNVRRHSLANTVSVSIAQNENRVKLRIIDNGIGFDPTLVSNENFGLKSINRRAKLFGGSAKVDSSPGKGTTVEVTLPIRRSMDTISTAG